MQLGRLEAQLETSEFEELANSREATAEYDVNPGDYGTSRMQAISQDCPECGREGRLIGEVDVMRHVDVEFEQTGEVELELQVTHEYYLIDLIPTAFACNVCRLVLSGPQELRACSLPVSRLNVEDYQLGWDFDPRAAAEAVYGDLA